MPKPKRIGLSKIIAEYAEERDFALVAERHNLHRPDVRRSMSKASKRLLESKDPHEAGLGAYIHSLIDKANPSGKGYSKRKVMKSGNLVFNDPETLNQFEVRMDDPNFDALFVAKANR